MIRDLLEVSDINHRNKSGKTALMIAAMYGQCHCAQELLQRGGNKIGRIDLQLYNETQQQLW